MHDTQSLKFTSNAFSFFEELTENNTKAWFDENRDRFKNDIQAPFERIIEELSERLADAPIPLSGSRRSMFRMHRDVRFSKNKKPYRTETSAMLTPGGVKDELGPALFIQVGATESLAGCGYYRLSATQLSPIRQKIIDEADSFRAVKKSIADARLTLSDGDRLKTMPRGFNEYSDHEHADELRLKSLLLRLPITKSAWISGTATGKIETFARACMPLLTFANITDSTLSS